MVYPAAAVEFIMAVPLLPAKCVEVVRPDLNEFAVILLFFGLYVKSE
jgi:hypothetical protein